MDLEKIKKEIEKFSSDRDWDQFHSIKNLSIALSVETAELLEISQWLTEAQSNLIATNPITLNKLEDEVADIFIYLMKIATKTNIDLEKAVINKLKKNAEKYPINLSKGNAKKYNEF